MKPHFNNALRGMFPARRFWLSGILLCFRNRRFLSDSHNTHIEHSLLSKLHNQLVKRILLVQNLLIFHICRFLMILFTHHHLRHHPAIRYGYLAYKTVYKKMKKNKKNVLRIKPSAERSTDIYASEVSNKGAR
jgi:hypothetical protein